MKREARRLGVARRSPRTGGPRRAPWAGLLSLFLLLALAACGGGGGTTATVPDPGDGGNGGGGGGTTPVAPSVLAITPTTMDRDQGADLRIDGERLAPGVTVRLLDDQDQAVLAPLAAVVSANGTRADVTVPPIPGPGASVTLRVEVRRTDGAVAPETPALVAERLYRAADGAGPIEVDPGLGQAGLALLRRAAVTYADGVSAMAGPDRPNARAVSNAVCRQTEDVPNAAGASDMFWQWGQFLDHDIDLTPEAVPTESANIQVPTGDAEFDPEATGAVVLSFHRSAYEDGPVPRQQVNAITAWIDASNVYGSDEVRAQALRTLDGTGRLRTSAGDLLPYNEDGLDNAGGTGADLFLAGDVRANEQVGLTTLHTLFVREHNRIADDLRSRHPELSGDEIYQEARRVVAAEVQVITYEEFLPLLLGPDGLPPYTGFDPSVDPGIANEFSTAAYRFGHSLLSDTLLRVDAAGLEIPEGNLALRDAFFAPYRLATEGGIDPVLRGLALGRAQELDVLVVEDVRSFLFGPPGAGGLDLAALNVQRGRDHGLATYNQMRAAYGLPTRATFQDVTSDPALAAALESTYGDVARLDAWIGALAEDHVPGAMVGSLLRRVVSDQMRRLRDGDPFFYERTFAGDELDAVRQTRLSAVIRRNTDIRDEIPNDAFRVPGAGAPRPPAPAGPPPSGTRLERIRSIR